jgi:hypothetical protein
VSGLDPLDPEIPAPRVRRPWQPVVVGERIVPAARLFPDGDIPAEVIVLRPEEGDATVVTCPLTGVPLTEPMAAAAGIGVRELTWMLERKAPLSLDPQTWEQVVAAVDEALDADGDGPPALSAGAVRVALGGSAVACFSSAKTTLEKKHFPADEAELESMVRASPLNAGLPEPALARQVANARDVYRRLQLGDRVPKAVWFDILHVLGDIEESGDLDLQLHSEVIDRVLEERSLQDPGIRQRRETDRLGRWHPLDVYSAFPALVRLGEALSRVAPVSLEFLGPGGDRTMAERTDWWPVAGRDGR